MSRSRFAWITSCIADASATTRSARAVAGRRPVDAGLTGSCRRLLRLWLRWLSLCRRLLKLRLLNLRLSLGGQVRRARQFMA